MINILLIVLMVVIPLLLLACNVYIMVYFQNPEEKGVSWLWRILVILALEFLEISVFMIPADVLNVGPPEGKIPIEIIWYVVYYVMIAFAVIVMPFGLCWYSYDEDTKFPKKLGLSILFGIVFLVVFLVFAVVLYLLFGVAEVPVTYQNANLMENFDLEKLKSAEVRPSDDDKTYTIKFRLAPVLFLIAGMSTVGYVLVLVFGGLGMGALPVSLIYDFINRPMPIKQQDYKKITKCVGQRALEMIDEGKEIKTLTGRKYRKRYQKFREEVYIIDKGLKALNNRHALKGFLWGYVALVLGIICAIISLLWVVQLVVWTILKIFPLIDWCMGWMTGKLSFFGSIFYAIFAVYLLACVFKGVTYVGFRFALGFLFYPMEVGNTYMSAFCFNTILLILGAFGVNQFCTETFSNFTEGTTIQCLYVNERR